MTNSADQTKILQERHLRELRLVIPDPRSPDVRRRVADQVAALSKEDEAEALDWIESVSEFDGPSSDPNVDDQGLLRK